MVLAGGRSRRFGSPKAEADFGGAPLVLRSVLALRPHVGVLALNGPAALAARLGLPRVEDQVSAAPGPLAGLAGSLLWARAGGYDVLLTAPCDTPFLPQGYGPALLAGVLKAPVAVAEAGRAHPLCAAWRVSVADAVLAVARLERQPPLGRLIRELGGCVVPFQEEAAFANVNTPADYAAAVARLP